MSLPTRSEYEALIYSLPAHYPEIAASTLHLFSTSATVAILQGEVEFTSTLRLQITEVVDFRIGRIREYSYTVFQGGQRIRWYDPQPHPENPALQPTFPHHYHEEPDIKHNRLPAYGISFDQPNLKTVIEVCIKLGGQLDKPNGKG
jgi:hypothetical protein